MSVEPDAEKMHQQSFQESEAHTETDTETEEKDLAGQLEQARTEIVQLSEERDSERDKAMRLAAELENTRRRLERDKSDAVLYAAANFARDILSVSDNLTRAIEAVGEDAPEAVLPLKTGVEATARELAAIFERHNVKRVPAMGLPLDPNVHQAMIEMEDAKAEPGTVVAEIQAGYTMKDRLLRPALVGVAKAPADEAVSNAG